MYDLSATMFYHTQFHLLLEPEAANDPKADLLWMTILHIRGWLLKKYNHDAQPPVLPTALNPWSRLKIQGRDGSIHSHTRFPHERELLLTATYFRDDRDMNFWGCTIVERPVPQKGFAPRTWTTEIGFQQLTQTQALFSCVVYYSDLSGHIGPIEEKPVPTVPNLLLQMMSDPKLQCSYGIDTFTKEPHILHRADAEAFWNRLLNPGRTLPYLLLTPRSEIQLQAAQQNIPTKATQLPATEAANTTPCESQPFIVSPNQLAYALGGNAMIYYAADSDAAAALAEIMPAKFRCDMGQIRCYVPQINLTNNRNESFRHRFLTNEQITAWGEMHIIEMFRRALIQNVRAYENCFRMENVKRMQQSAAYQQRLLELHNKHQTEVAEITDSIRSERSERQAAEEQYLEAAIHAEELQVQIDDLQSQLFTKDQVIEGMRGSAERTRELEAALHARMELAEMATLADVFAYFSKIFAERLVFTDSAWSTLKSCTLSITDLWNWLFQLATEMYPLLVKGGANPEKVFQARTGIVCGRGEGTQTRSNSKLMQQYRTYYNGEEINIEMHLKSKDRKQSLHFGFLRSEKKLIIAHCGAHLDNASTRKQH